MITVTNEKKHIEINALEYKVITVEEQKEYKDYLETRLRSIMSLEDFIKMTTGREI